jgi:hypothetical protein
MRFILFLAITSLILDWCSAFYTSVTKTNSSVQSYTTTSSPNSALHAFPFETDSDTRRCEIRAVDPSEAPQVGSPVVLNSDMSEFGMYQFQSYPVQAIYDQSSVDASQTPIRSLEIPIPDGYTRYVTLGSRRGSITMKLSGSYNHGLSSLWILERQDWVKWQKR